MATTNLNQAKEILELYTAEVTVSELSQQFGLHRPIIYQRIKLAQLPEKLLDIYLKGFIGEKPLVEMYEKYQAHLFGALERILDERKQQNSTKKIKSSDVEKILNNDQSSQAVAAKSTLTHPKSKQNVDLKSLTTEPSHIENPDALSNSIAKMRSILREAGDANQDSADNHLRLSADDFKKLLREIDNIEQFFDEAYGIKEEQGDPTDQTKNSYVFDNMVEQETNLDMFPSYEDLSQDPSDYQ